MSRLLGECLRQGVRETGRGVGEGGWGAPLRSRDVSEAAEEVSALLALPAPLEKATAKRAPTSSVREMLPSRSVSKHVEAAAMRLRSTSPSPEVIVEPRSPAVVHRRLRERSREPNAREDEMKQLASRRAPCA